MPKKTTQKKRRSGAQNYTQNKAKPNGSTR